MTALYKHLKVTKNLTNLHKKFCEFPHRALICPQGPHCKEIQPRKPYRAGNCRKTTFLNKSDQQLAIYRCLLIFYVTEGLRKHVGWCAARELAV